MNKVLNIGAICFLITVAIYNVRINESFEKENNLLLTSLFTMAEANAETTASVTCKDAITVGSGGDGPYRMCMKNNAAYCSIDYYSGYLSMGTCSVNN